MAGVWQRAAGLTALALYFLFFTEWLFYVTKPSFFSVLSPAQAAMVLVIAPLPWAGIALGLLAVARGVELAGTPVRVSRLLYAALPALPLTAALILLIDNFSYTVLEIGVVSVRNALRFLYAVFFIALYVGVVRVLARSLGSGGGRVVWATGLVGVSLLGALLALATRASIHQPNAPVASAGARPPDIFLIRGDGLEVADFEIYREPIGDSTFFKPLGPHAVVFQNNFPNANRTAATTALVLTGKYATTTHKHNGSRFFAGSDAYQHLPGLLRSLGYRSIQIGAGHHLDSFYWGMRNAFDVHNQTTVDRSMLDRLSDRLGGRLNWDFHFTQVLAERIGERLRHAFGGALMEQPHLIAKQKLDKIDGEVMVDQLLDFLEQHPGPVFAQLHSMSTRHWKPERDPGPRAQALDDYVSRIVDDLVKTGRFENSIIVIWSDHGRRYTKDRRLPLIVKFPGPVEVPQRDWNTQTIDIPPTILDFLGLPIPPWMEGRSLLRPIERYEPIFSIRSHWDTPGIEPDSPGASVKGGISELGLIVCNKSYTAHFASGRLYLGWIDGHTTPCDPDLLPDDRRAADLILQHLVERGYGPAVGAETP